MLENIKDDQRSYVEIAEKGQILEKILTTEDVNPDSIRSEYVKALDINSHIS